MKAKFFPRPADWRKWLQKHHQEEQELWVGFYKKKTGRPSIDWPQSVDEALCFGWIDGKRVSLGEESYAIRFTPRRATSLWSAVNIGRVEELTKLGRMRPAGIEAFQRRTAKKSERYSYEQQDVILDRRYQSKIRANKKAWAFFQKLAPSYRKPSIWWVMSAKKEETRLRRLDILIRSSAEGMKIPLLRWNNGKLDEPRSHHREANMPTRARYPMPADVRRSLVQQGLMEAYRLRPPYQQNDYIGWITRAKREETRQKRLAQMLDELKRGDRYMKMAYRAKRPR